jgi:hypothetical protein
VAATDEKWLRARKAQHWYSIYLLY